MELISIRNHNGSQAVLARELHSFLESKRQFTNWIQSRIVDYGFIENQDYTTFLQIKENSKGGRPLQEYLISMDMAKELSMLERSEKGKEARKYFIECEKILRKQLIKEEILHQPQMLIPFSDDIIPTSKEMYKELMSLIKKNLFRGDISQIAREYDIERYKLQSVLNGASRRAEIVKVLYQKAMENRRLLENGIGLMINNLKAS